MKLFFRRSRHRRAQMKSLSGGKWRRKLIAGHERNLWNYARENRMSDKRMF